MYRPQSSGNIRKLSGCSTAGLSSRRSEVLMRSDLQRIAACLVAQGFH